MVDEPDQQATRDLKGVRSRYEKHHKVKIDDDALECGRPKLSSRYI